MTDCENSYEIVMENIFTEDEKIVYAKILKELEENKQNYEKSGPEDEKTRDLICNCNITQQELYAVMKKVVNFHRTHDLNNYDAEGCEELENQ